LGKFLSRGNGHLWSGAGYCPEMGTKARIWSTAVFAVLLALATWAELTGHLMSAETRIGVLVAVAVAILAGLLVARWWAIAVLVGPAALMLVLEVTGYYTHAYLEWGERPLFSPEGIATLFWQALAVEIGIALAIGIAAVSSWRRRRGRRPPREFRDRGRRAGH
jgi:hypothetical protein